jgi:hypothetical protein
MCREISAYLTGEAGFSETRGVDVGVYFTM